MAHSDEPEDRTASAQPVVRPGTLLLSSTELFEPTFRRTVVYMLEHNDAGSLGVVLNRPSETSVQEVLPQWAPLAAAPEALYIGGPVTGTPRCAWRPSAPASTSAGCRDCAGSMAVW